MTKDNQQTQTSQEAYAEEIRLYADRIDYWRLFGDATITWTMAAVAATSLVSIIRTLRGH